MGGEEAGRLHQPVQGQDRRRDGQAGRDEGFQLRPHPGRGLRAVQEQLHPAGKACQRERAGQRQRHLGRVWLELRHTGRPERLSERDGGTEQRHEQPVQSGAEPVHPEEKRPAEPADRLPAGRGAGLREIPDQLPELGEPAQLLPERIQSGGQRDTGEEEPEDGHLWDNPERCRKPAAVFVLKIKRPAREGLSAKRKPLSFAVRLTAALQSSSPGEHYPGRTSQAPCGAGSPSEESLRGERI